MIYRQREETASTSSNTNRSLQLFQLSRYVSSSSLDPLLRPVRVQHYWRTHDCQSKLPIRRPNWKPPPETTTCRRSDGPLHRPNTSIENSLIRRQVGGVYLIGCRRSSRPHRAPKNGALGKGRGRKPEESLPCPHFEAQGGYRWLLRFAAFSRRTFRRPAFPPPDQQPTKTLFSRTGTPLSNAPPVARHVVSEAVSLTPTTLRRRHESASS